MIYSGLCIQDVLNYLLAFIVTDIFNSRVGAFETIGHLVTAYQVIRASNLVKDNALSEWGRGGVAAQPVMAGGRFWDLDLVNSGRINRFWMAGQS